MTSQSSASTQQPLHIASSDDETNDTAVPRDQLGNETFLNAVNEIIQKVRDMKTIVAAWLHGIVETRYTDAFRAELADWLSKATLFETDIEHNALFTHDPDVFVQDANNQLVDLEQTWSEFKNHPMTSQMCESSSEDETDVKRRRL